MNLQKKKILFADLDGTLITTSSGKTFAEDCTDFRLRKDVLDKIKTLRGLSLLAIVTNQAGIPKYVSEHDFIAKLRTICEFIRLYVNDEPDSPDAVEVEAHFCMSPDEDDPRRKPNDGMLEEVFSVDGALYYASPVMKDKNNMLMIGDASGKKGQFSDSDKMCAANFGIDYLDVDDFLAISS